MSKNTNAEVREIRERYAAGGISQPQLAKEYGLTLCGVNYIVVGKTRMSAGGPITKKGRSSLTPEAVMQIVSELKDGIPRKEIARTHGVRYNSICDIATGVSWRHVTGIVRK
jgi:hypothetical protein